MSIQKLVSKARKLGTSSETHPIWSYCNLLKDCADTLEQQEMRRSELEWKVKILSKFLQEIADGQSAPGSQHYDYELLAKKGLEKSWRE